jgi:hypothetical protein
MASKVLKVKLWDGEDGKKWKCNIQDIEGEILCGASRLVCPPVLSRSRRSLRLTSCPAIMVPSIDEQSLPPTPCHANIVPLFSFQSHNSLFSLQRRKATSPTFTKRLRRPKARSYTTASLARSAPFTKKTVSRTASSVR